MVNGERKEARKTKDEFGAPFKTKREAIKVRQAAIEQEQNARKPKPTVRKTVAEVYQEYCEKGQSGKAYNTIRKQENLWVNHLCAAFGKRYIDEISAAEVVDYLTELYYKQIFSTELVNCLPNGKIQTVNSMKYPTREIKVRFHIDFKYHHLRHTYGTLMAEMNTPTHLLCNQMGHGNIQVTQRYYIAVSKSGGNILQGNLNML